MNTTHRIDYIKISAFIFLYFVIWTMSFSLYSIWLGQHADLTSAEIGAVFAVNGAFAVVMKPVYGFITDKLGMKKYLLYFVAIMSSLLMPFFVYVYHPLLSSHFSLGVVAGALYLSLAWYAGIAASESYCDRFGRLKGFEFGRIRMWGSCGAAVTASFAGILFNISPTINFTISSITSLIMLALLVSIKIPASDNQENAVVPEKKISLPDVRRLLKDGKFWRFCFYVAGIVWIMHIAEQQFPRYFISFFHGDNSGTSWYGYLSTVQAIVEFISMLTMPWVVNKLGARKALIFAGLVIGLRLVVSGFATGPLMIAFIKPLYGLENALLLIAVFKYIANHFDKKVNATMYLIGYQCTMYVGTIFVSAPVGYLYDHIGFGNTYFIMGGIVILFALLSIFVLSDNDERLALASNTKPSVS
ncbi:MULTISPECIES: oligosaccharide MFS transporter [unclassified Enterobacter]|uniref:oligosaccharide MFS transporter n=1 Tax=unclassified Enterobacter TaxID=2608935 RepID=UPI00296FC916|nr:MULTISPECIES: oligosaccharide MFS transporter [unclassified Enterobacter]WJD48580.1 oligosaccharide MFS transporter [Enterobacter sp. PGRG2]